MRNKTSIILATAIIGSLSLATLSTSAFAHDRERAMGKQNSQTSEQMGKRGKMGQRGQQPGFMRLICADDGAVRLEKALGKFDEKLTLTDTQKPLFDEFKTAALTAQTSFSDNCTVPVRGGDANVIDRMKTRQANMAAHLTAVEEFMPQFEALFDSLTDDQKTALKQGRRGQGHDRDHHGKGYKKDHKSRSNS